MRLRVTILGCGGSMGVPMVGNLWGNCDPANPRNRRRRPSILMESDSTVLLVDTSPDLRCQLLDARATRIDAVLYTHGHADHVHGIDDLRPFTYVRRGTIPAFTDAATLAALEERFGYALSTVPVDRGLYPPILTPHLITGPFTVGDVAIRPFVQEHGSGESLGFRIGGFAYSTDVSNLGNAAFAALDELDTWVVDACREEPHPSHAHLARTLEWIERLRPRRAYLTHMNQTLDYGRLMATLPPGIEPAYDGLVIEL